MTFHVSCSESTPPQAAIRGDKPTDAPPSFITLYKVGEPNFDTTEDILTYTKPSSEIPKLVAEGKITHSLVVAAFYWHYLYKEAQAKN